MSSSRIPTRRPVWAPYYTLHKILAGLIDANQLCENTEALAMAERLAGWVTFRTDRLTHAHASVLFRLGAGENSEGRIRWMRPSL